MVVPRLGLMFRMLAREWRDFVSSCFPWSGTGASSSAKRRQKGEILAAGVENATSVHDRQVVQNVQRSPVVAAYVDIVAVVGENRPRVMDTTTTVKNPA